jgi:hypothetical protein
MPTFDIVAKSGIMPVPTSYANYAATGLPPHSTRLPTLGVLPGLPILPATEYTENINAPVTELSLFCAALNASTHDTMTSAAKDRQYRMYSQLRLDANTDASGLFVVRVAGQSTSAFTPSMFITEVGLEGGVLTPPPLNITELRLQMTNPNKYVIEWLTLGRPAPVAEPGFTEICWRDCVYIWHKVSLAIERSGPMITCTPTLTGSKFPTHAAWVDGTKRASIAQGAIGRLWVPFAPGSSRVA